MGTVLNVIGYILIWSQVEKKTPFSLSRKAKICEKSLTFCKILRNFVLRKITFSQKFLFLGWFSRKVSVFAKDFAKNVSFCKNFREKISFLPRFRILIHIQLASGSGFAFRMLNFREHFRETENFRENENFVKLFFAKFSRKYVNENCRYNPIIGARLPVTLEMSST
jgi:hypothetical protein